MSDDREVGIVSKRNDLLVDHKSEDSGHGSASVVEFDGTLGELLFLVELIPSEVNVSVAEVTDELVSGSGDILHETNFEESDESNKLDKSGSRDGVRSDKGGNSVGERVEGVSGEINVSGKVDSSSGGDLSKEGKHTNTSVLDFNVSETVESLLVDVTVEESERIEESEGWLDTELVLEGLDSGGGGLLLGRGEGSGGGDEGCEDSGFHFEFLGFGLFEIKIVRKGVCFRKTTIGCKICFSIVFSSERKMIFLRENPIEVKKTRKKIDLQCPVCCVIFACYKCFNRA